MKLLKRLWLASLFTFLVLFGSGPSHALAPWIEESFEWNLRVLASRSIPYVWGSIDPRVGLDCSGYVYVAIIEALRKAGCPVSRVTARDMFMGVGGWRGHNFFSVRDARNGDLEFFTSGKKPWRHDHVGVVLKGKHGLELAQSRGGKGVVITPRSDYPGSVKWSDGFRHLTLGE